MTESLQLKRDLQDEADYQAVSSATGYGPTYRAELVRATLPNSADVTCYNSGGYQGFVGIVIEYDGHTWVIKDSYGSCSHCDGLLGASVEEQRSYTKRMLRDAYCFLGHGAAALYVAEADGYGWGMIREGVLTILRS